MTDYDIEFKEKIDQAKKECIATIMGCHRKMMYGTVEIPVHGKEKDHIMSMTVSTEINKLLGMIL